MRRPSCMLVGRALPMADGRTSRAHSRRASTRNALLRAARTRFRAQGVHDTSIDDIVRAAGVARGTFYLYFRNKEDVLGALVDAFIAAIRGAVRRIDTTPGAPSPAEQIRDNLRRICDVLERHEDVAAIVFMGPAGLDGRSADAVARFWQQIEAMVRDALAVGQGLGVVRPCNRQQVAIMALGAVRAALSRTLTEGDDATNDVDRPRFDEDFLEELVTYPLRGLLR